MTLIHLLQHFCFSIKSFKFWNIGLLGTTWRTGGKLIDDFSFISWNSTTLSKTHRKCYLTCKSIHYASSVISHHTLAELCVFARKHSSPWAGFQSPLDIYEPWGTMNYSTHELSVKIYENSKKLIIGIFSSVQRKLNFAFYSAVFNVPLELKLFSSANFWIRSISSFVVDSDTICGRMFDLNLKMSIKTFK